MSKLITALPWYPPEFPEQGRLPVDSDRVARNYYQQESLERAWHNELCLAKGRRILSPCSKTLHISLFFDGTGNNLNNDLYLSQPPHPTNIARLFSAAIGSGTAGGVSNPSGLFDTDPLVSVKYFKYYLPGVGTPFPEINDLDYSTMGLVGAKRGEDRINWALLRIIDALKRSMNQPGQDTLRLTDAESRSAIAAMATSWGSLGIRGSHNRYEEFSRQLKKLEAELRPALLQPVPGRPKLLGIKLYVYGFSRGAAGARAFVKWLSELLPKPASKGEKPEQCLRVGELSIPISVEFLGLLDTVASVGIAHIMPIAEGHMDWADGTMELPEEERYGGLIKRCVHLVSSHEQRLCFPLDSIRRTDGTYPAGSQEVVYPGMHSDIGGGYSRGDQGKGRGKRDNLLLSQIALHDLYADAFAAGAPLKVPKEALPDDWAANNWRRLSLDQITDFSVSADLADRFNAWRELTLNLPASPESITSEQAATYNPHQAAHSLEQEIEHQMAWITAWRIHRYAKGSMQRQPFYQEASNSDWLPENRRASKAQRDEKQKQVERRRKEMLAGHSAEKAKALVLEPGVKDFDPDISRSQLREAAEEFHQDYFKGHRFPGSIPELLLETIPSHAIFLINTDDERLEYGQMKTAGETKEAILFPPAGEASNADTPAGRLRALFDDQVHDSRAWFMHAILGFREPWSSYFRYRMIYFGDKSNKSLSLLAVAGNVVGAATLVGGVIFTFKQKGVKGKLAGVAGTVGLMSLQAEALDILTRKKIPLLENADALTAPTTEPGRVVAEQRAAIEEARLAFIKATIRSEWLEMAKSTLTS